VGPLADALYEAFRDPPREHTPLPFWFWNGRLTAAEVCRQIDVMVAQHVYGAYAHCRSGLEPRYLSEAWWRLVEAAVAHAHEVGFRFCVVDEYNWPSGDARDYTLERYPSRVLAVDEAYRMRTLDPQRGFREGADFVVAGRRRPCGELDGSSLRLVESDDGDVVWSFTLRDAVGFDGGLVDLMNPDAVRAFLDLVYEEYRRRLGAHFGTTFGGMFVDHEGDIGWRLAWTPALRETFRREKGYDLVPQLPLLLEEGGSRTPVVRCDYFDVVAGLYARSFFRQLSACGREHGLDVTGHVWEESLHAAAAFEGDHLRILREWTTPGVDSLFEWGRTPRHFLEARSVAHFERRGLVCENQGVQGAGDYLSPERLKRTTNAIGAWGVTRFVPHALNGNPDRTDFPEDWFERQPWWPWFHCYADYTRRISFMNSGGRHVCEVAVYYPIESVWAHGDPCFLAEKWDYSFAGADNRNGPRVTWGNHADEVDRVYGEIQETLPREQWDLDVVDDHYLAAGTIDGGRLHIADESFGVLVLPPMTCMRLSAACRARELGESGALVVAVGRLATDSMENGRDDPELAAALARVHVVPDTAALVALLDARVPKDVRTDAADLLAYHRVKDGRHVYWLVNDRDERRTVLVELAARGAAEIWDPDGGDRRLVPRNGPSLVLGFEPWQAYYVIVQDAEERAGASPPPVFLRERTLAGRWRVTPELGETPIPYAEDGRWLSKERYTIRDWWVAGPFDYRDHLGYHERYPPESAVDLDAVYEGKHGPVRWRRYTSPGRIVDLDEAAGLRPRPWSGVRFATAYAFTTLDCDAAREGELRLTADSNAKAWLNGELVHAERDDHQGYLELRDAFGYRIPVRLRAGQNTLLLKVSQGMRYGGVFGFVCRLCEPDGHPLMPPAGCGEHCVRVRVPAGTTSLRLPRGAQGAELRLDGDRVERVATDHEAVLEIRTPLPLQHELVCVLGPAERPLGSLTSTGLAWYCGTLLYETAFEAGGDERRLDLGDVGVTAQVELNGTDLGRRAWRPFAFDVAGVIRPGANELRVRVANTRANERARGPDLTALWGIPVRGRALLDGIDLNGLHGPVRLLG
jgi:hypothetical protein